MADAQIDFIGRIKSAYNQFTRAERKVADYITDHPREMLFMSITELADACGVGETSVFRFCRTVGLGGYQEFKMQLSLSMQGTGRQSGGLSGEITPEDGLEAVAQKVLHVDQQALSETAALLDLEALSRAVDYMGAAGRIEFFGVGASLVAAQRAAHKFMRVEPKVRCVGDAHAQAMVAANMAAGDVAVVISYSGSTKDTNAVAQLAKAAGAKVVVITRFHKSPLTEFSDVTLLCGANESPLQGGSTSADISQSFLFDLLYTEYYRRNWETCGENNRKSAESVINKMY